MTMEQDRYNEIQGDLVALAIKGKFDVIAHGCNCFCTQKKGLAALMAKAFGTDDFKLEHGVYRGDINKLGTIDYDVLPIEDCKGDPSLEDNITRTAVAVVNCYTQYMWATPENPVPLDYEALSLVLKKLNHEFKGKHIGLPKIGCGLAGGNWAVIRPLIQRRLEDCKVTVVIRDETEKEEVVN